MNEASPANSSTRRRPAITARAIRASPLDVSWFEPVGVNASAVERRAASLAARRSVKKDYQAAWLVRALTCLDLTTLAGDDTPGRVRRLCAKARRPLDEDLLDALGLTDAPPTVGAVCVYPTMVGPAVKALAGSGIPVASVATGFPAGLTPLKQRLAEIDYALSEGAGEIDIVITRAHVAQPRVDGALRRSQGDARSLRRGASQDDPRHRRFEDAAQRLLGEHGGDAGGRRFHQDLHRQGRRQRHLAGQPGDAAGACATIAMLTGFEIGFKPAGGLRTAKDALNWLILMKEELGLPWMRSDLFRIGASSLLTDIERQLSHYATGRYSANYRHAMA